jgi:hypothetical protein
VVGGSDRELGLNDLDEAGRFEKVGDLARSTKPHGRGFVRGRWIGDQGSIPERPEHLHSLGKFPHTPGHDPAVPHDPAKFNCSCFGFRHEMENQLGHCKAEAGIIKREGLGSPDTHVDTGKTSRAFGRESGRRITS